MKIYSLQTGPLNVNTIIVQISSEKAFAVDPAACGFSYDEDSIADFLKSKNLSLCAVVLTHGHFDHISGLPFLKKSFPNVQILIHKSDAQLIGENSRAEQKKHLSKMGFLEFLPFVSNLPNPDSFLEEGKTLLEILDSAIGETLDDEEKKSLDSWKIIETPGHTPGSVCLFNEDEKVLLSGDTLFDGSFGRTDLPGGDFAEIQKSLAKISKNIPNGTSVYSGHDFRPFEI